MVKVVSAKIGVKVTTFFPERKKPFREKTAA